MALLFIDIARNFKRPEKDSISFYFKIFMIAWVLYSCFILLFSTYKDEAFKALFAIVFAYIYVSTFQSLFRFIGKNWFVSVSWGVFIAYIASIIVAIWEITTFNHLPSQYSENLESYKLLSLTSTAFSGNPNNLSFFLVLSTVCLFFLLQRVNFFLKSVLFICIVVINPLIIFLNESRLGLFIYFVLLFWFLIGFSVKKRNIVLVACLLCISLIVFSDALLAFLDGVDLTTRLIQKDSLEDESSAIRFAHIYNFFHYTLSTFGLGLGPGQYEAMGHNHFYYVAIENPHNLFMEIGLNYGLYILVTFTFFLTSRILLYAKLNRYLLTITILILALSPVNSSYINDNVSWLFIAIIFNSFSKKELANLTLSHQL